MRRKKIWRTLTTVFRYLKDCQEEKSTFISFDLRIIRNVKNLLFFIIKLLKKKKKVRPCSLSFYLIHT